MSLAHWAAAHDALIAGGGIDVLLGMAVWIALASGRAMLGVTAFAAAGGQLAATIASSGAGAGAAAAGAAIAGAVAGALFGLLVERSGSVGFAAASFALGAAVSLAASPARIDRAHAAMLSTASLVAAAFVVTIVVFVAMRTRYGRAARAVEQDAAAAIALGIAPRIPRLWTASACGAIAALAGALAVLHQQPDASVDLGFARGIAAIGVAVVGGAGSAFGPVIGAVVLALVGVAVPGARHAAAADAALLLAFSAALPGGIASVVARALRR